MKIRIEESLTQEQLNTAKDIARVLISNGLSKNYFTLDKKKGEIVKVKEFPVTWDIGITNLKVTQSKTISVEDGGILEEYIISDVRNDEPITFLYFDGE